MIDYDKISKETRRLRNKYDDESLKEIISDLQYYLKTSGGAYGDRG